MTNKRPKSLRVPSNAVVAATIGNSISRTLTGAKAGFILIIVDEEGAALSTSESAEETVNVLSHFIRDTDVFATGYLVQECACSDCQTFRRTEKGN